MLLIESVGIYLGPSGVGKSEIVDTITQERAGMMIDLRLALMEPTDLRGIPYYNEKTGQMMWAPPARFAYSRIS